METSLVILRASDIMEIYKLTRNETYEILKSKGCPLIRGGDGKSFLVEQSAFEDFLMNRSQKLSRKCY